ncbi:MAG: hypothetical protein EOO73_33410 [Myxococcales bacterium]|nr:MAG: hypothetical protein EOO73_33410 [Myxococcales bacterium]
MKTLWPSRRPGCGTCYLFAVGAAAEPWRLAKLLESHAPEDVEVTPAPELIRAVFPPEDSVRVVTRRSCSCDLVEAAPRVGRSSRLHVALRSMLRVPLVRSVSELAALRVYVSSGAEPTPFALPPRRLPLDAWSALVDDFPLDQLLELASRRAVA